MVPAPQAADAATNTTMPVPYARRHGPVGEGTAEQQQGGEHQRVPSDNPLQPGQAAAQVSPDAGKRDVDHLGVERDDEEPSMAAARAVRG